MRTEIKLTGITTSGAYADGDCHTLVNLRQKNGVLSVVAKCAEVEDLQHEYSLLFVHRLPDTGENLIGVREKKLWLIKRLGETANEEIMPLDSGEVSVTQIGNVLNIIDKERLKYVIWFKNEYSSISDFFNNTPDAELVTPLRVELRNTLAKKNRDGGLMLPRCYASADKTEYNKENITKAIKGLWTKAIACERENGYETGFYLAQAVLELMDGSQVTTSPPCLICQSVDEQTRYFQNRAYVYYSSYGGIKIKLLSDYPEQGTVSEEIIADDNNSFELEQSFEHQSLKNKEKYCYTSKFVTQETTSSGSYENKYPTPNLASVEGESNEHWIFIEKRNDPDLPEWQENCYNYPAGTRFKVKQVDSKGNPRYLIYERSTTPFVGYVPLPNMVGYYAEGYSSNIHDGISDTVNADYNCVITRRSSLQYRIHNEIDPLLKKFIRNLSVFITPAVSMYAEDREFLHTTFGSVAGYTPKIHNFIYPSKTDEEIIKELMSQENFYKVHEIAFEDITPGDWIDIDLKGKLGESLLFGERMSVLPSPHTNFAKVQKVYNSRLHLANVTEKLFRGFPVGYFEQTRGEGQFRCVVPANLSLFRSSTLYAIVELETNTGTLILIRHSTDTETTSQLLIDGLSPLLSYPDARAKKITFIKEVFWSSEYYSYSRIVLSFKLKAHPTHNFAYFIAPDMKPFYFFPNSLLPIPDIPDETEMNEYLINTVKVSQLNNPLYFDPRNTYTVGTGVILNISSYAMNVTDRNFGSFPLFVFTGEGIFAMSVSGDGEVVYSSVQAMSTRDIPLSSIICQTPAGVVFISERGISIINGNETKLLTGCLEQKGRKLNINTSIASHHPVVPEEIDFNAFKNGIGMMLMNRKENELILVNKNAGYHLVFSFDANVFTKTTEEIGTEVKNSFPDLLFTSAGRIKNLYATQGDTNYVKLITRPLRFGTRDMKKLERFILRAACLASPSSVFVIYGSLDEENYTLLKAVGTTGAKRKDFDFGLFAGSKYKSFVVAFAADMSNESFIKSLDFEIVKEYDNTKMR